VRQLSATTGLPHVMVRRNMEKVKAALVDCERVISGLTRGLDMDVLDRGIGEVAGSAVSFIPRSPTLGVVLPSNSPGVHALWVPTIALRVALVLKPGSAEPWTPYRVIQAFLKAGVPETAFGFYPTDHAGSGEILRRCGRGIVFGDVASTRPWQSDPRVEVHGPGYSKVVLGPDASADWERHLAEALAARLTAVTPRATEDEQAQLAPFANPQVAERISAMIDRELETPGAEDVTARLRGSGRVARRGSSTYLLPTLVRCDSADHPLANREFLFPFASVVPVRPEEIPTRLGPTLAASVLTADEALLARILGSPLVHRLNLGALPTWKLAWDQPHEGNLFEHLYVRRALIGRAGVA
jgi:acyl-CoA reductase-like NAD-dependent aldehyde dehydrogenase